MENTITLDEETCRRISRSKAPLLVVDPSGTTVATILSLDGDFPDSLDGNEMTKDEVDRILADPRTYTTEDMLRLVEV